MGRTSVEIESFIIKKLHSLSFDLYDLEQMGNSTFCVYIQKDKKSPTVSDCQLVSRNLKNELIDFLAVDDVFLEVSSPGLNRKLKKIEHFLEARGLKVRLKVKEMQEDQKNFEGVLVDVSQDHIILQVNDQQLAISLQQIISARVIPILS